MMRVLVSVAAVAVLAPILFLFPSEAPAPVVFQEPAVIEGKSAALKVNGAVIIAEIVREQEDLQRGLSGRESLPEGEGLLFDFGYSGRWGIWMKDMNFPIDIVWLDEEMKILTVKTSVAPDTYPEVFYPTSEARYVLEIPSGTVEKYRIEVGNRVSAR